MQLSRQVPKYTPNDKNAVSGTEQIQMAGIGIWDRFNCFLTEDRSCSNNASFLHHIRSRKFQKCTRICVKFQLVLIS